MELHVSRFSNIICISIFLSIYNEVLGQNDGKCLREYETESSYKAENVIYVCTNGPIPNYTDVLYMDTARVPVAQFSSCSCMVTFAGDGPHSVRLDYKHDSDQRISLFIDGFTTNFSERDESKNVSVITKQNIVNFSVNSMTSRQNQACLRVSLIKQGTRVGSSFQASCTQAETAYESQSSTTGERTTESSNQEESFLPANISQRTTVNIFMQGSTSMPIQDTTNETPDNRIPGVVIGTAVGGILFFTGLIVKVVIVVKLRKKAKPQDNQNFTALNRGSQNQPNQDLIDHYDEIAQGTQTSIENSNQDDAVAHDYSNIPTSLVNGAEYSSLDRHICNPADHEYTDLSGSKTGLVNQVHTYYNSPAEFKTNA